MLVPDSKVDESAARAQLEQAAVEMKDTFDAETQKLAAGKAQNCCCIDLVASSDGKWFLATETNYCSWESQAIELEKYCSPRKWGCMKSDDLLGDWTSKSSLLEIAKLLMGMSRMMNLQILVGCSLKPS